MYWFPSEIVDANKARHNNEKCKQMLRIDERASGREFIIVLILFLTPNRCPLMGILSTQVCDEPRTFLLFIFCGIESEKKSKTQK